jgi:hypothetical protein
MPSEDPRKRRHFFAAWLPGLLGGKPVRSELIYVLVGLDQRYTAESPGEPWESFYAREIPGHVQAGHS